MTNAQKIWYTFEWAGFPPPHGFDELVKSEHCVRGLLLNLNFLKMLFGDKTVGFTTKVVDSVAMKDKPIPMWKLAAQELVMEDDLVGKVYDYAKQKHDAEEAKKNKQNAKGN